MLKNILLDIEYDGTNYFGWQIQNISKAKSRELRLPTVQEKIEDAIEKLFGEKIKIAYAGRTDRGVHAKAQCVNFKVYTRIPLKNIRRALNTFLPKDIYVKKVKKMPQDFHCRFSTKSKIYRYIILNRNKFSVFTRNYAWHIGGKINLSAMRETASCIIGRKDFACFARQASAYKSCVRVVKNISIKKRGSFIYIDIEASGFLRNMARNIVSFLVMTGKEKLSQNDAVRIIEGKAQYTNKPAPPGGLYLIKVNYE